jgi:hypothetical protein
MGDYKPVDIKIKVSFIPIVQQITGYIVNFFYKLTILTDSVE